jgi:FMN-dependent NADH-azoreductase
MHNILFVTSSLMGETSTSRKLAGELLATVNHPEATVVERHLTPETIPHISRELLTALGTPEATRSETQRQALELADRLIEEVEAADTIVIASPMYNFSVPSTLKAWIDHIARAGRTFRYSVNGPEGLLKDKKLYVVASRGGYYAGGAPAQGMDFQEPYLRALFGFLGIRDVTFIHVEGQAMGAEAAAKGLTEAQRRINGALAQAA